MVESEGVGTEISTKIQKFLILIILRSQQLIGITAEKFYHINFKSFSEDCNTILKYFTVSVLGKN